MVLRKLSKKKLPKRKNASRRRGRKMRSNKKQFRKRTQKKKYIKVGGSTDFKKRIFETIVNDTKYKAKIVDLLVEIVPTPELTTFKAKQTLFGHNTAIQEIITKLKEKTLDGPDRTYKQRINGFIETFVILHYTPDDDYIDYKKDMKEEIQKCLKNFLNELDVEKLYKECLINTDPSSPNMLQATGWKGEIAKLSTIPIEKFLGASDEEKAKFFYLIPNDAY